MAWRLARSLDRLTEEIRSKYPGTTVWTIGDSAHRNTWSDHNPNANGVVCAADILGNGGLNLGTFAESVRKSNHPAFKYVIFNRRIAFRGGSWQAYYGSNPHTTHVHVSVGTGPDGRSTGPYDNRSSWKLWSDDVSAKDVWDGYFIDKVDEDSGSTSRMRPSSYLSWIHEYCKQLLAGQRASAAREAALATAVEALATGVGVDPAAIRQAAEDGARAALSEADITISWE